MDRLLFVRIASGFVLSLGVALFALHRKSLSRSGVVGALLTGTLTLGFGGWAWGITLILFFISSSLLTRWRKGRKTTLEQVFAKGGQRDLGQALANGGLGMVLAVLYGLWPHPAWAMAFAGALAAATADTWATEIGVLSSTPPRLITTGKPVPAGTSGGITFRGTLAEIGAGLFLGSCFFLFGRLESAFYPDTPSFCWVVIPLALLGGLSGAMVDSLLGATIQGIYRCAVCGKETERRRHCGEPTLLVRGRTWLTNDGVNFTATLVGAAVAGGVSLIL
jgi:uncharacterized protein (TIGR00297 family)